MEPNEWAKRVRKIHNCYIYCFFPVLGSLFVLVTLCAIIATVDSERNQFAEISIALEVLLVKILWAVVAAQVVSARAIFFRCPWSLLELYLYENKEVNEYWVVYLCPRWLTITLLTVLPVLIFILGFVCFIVYWPSFPELISTHKG